MEGTGRRRCSNACPGVNHSQQSFRRGVLTAFPLHSSGTDLTLFNRHPSGVFRSDFEIGSHTSVPRPMMTRRQFLRWLGGFGAVGALAATYGIAVEPMVRPR